MNEGRSRIRLGLRRGQYLGRNVLAISLAIILALSAAACRKNTGNEGGSGGVDHSKELAAAKVDLKATPNIIVDGNNVAIKFPGEMFDGVELSAEFIEVNEYIDAYYNSDGTVTVEMSKDRQQMFLYSFQDDIDYNIEYFLTNPNDYFYYLRDITYTDDFRFMEIYVDGDTEANLLYELPYFFSLPFEYIQQMLGQNTWMAMYVVDAETKDVILTVVFPEE